MLHQSRITQGCPPTKDIELGADHEVVNPTERCEKHQDVITRDGDNHSESTSKAIGLGGKRLGRSITIWCNSVWIIFILAIGIPVYMWWGDALGSQEMASRRRLDSDDCLEPCAYCIAYLIRFGWCLGTLGFCEPEMPWFCCTCFCASGESGTCCDNACKGCDTCCDMCNFEHCCGEDEEDGCGECKPYNLLIEKESSVAEKGSPIKKSNKKESCLDSIIGGVKKMNKICAKGCNGMKTMLDILIAVVLIFAIGFIMYGFWDFTEGTALKAIICAMMISVGWTLLYNTANMESCCNTVTKDRDTCTTNTEHACCLAKCCKCTDSCICGSRDNVFFGMSRMLKLGILGSMAYLTSDIAFRRTEMYYDYWKIQNMKYDWSIKTAETGELAVPVFKREFKNFEGDYFVYGDTYIPKEDTEEESMRKVVDWIQTLPEGEREAAEKALFNRVPASKEEVLERLSGPMSGSDFENSLEYWWEQNDEIKARFQSLDKLEIEGETPNRPLPVVGISVENQLEFADGTSKNEKSMLTGLFDAGKLHDSDQWKQFEQMAEEYHKSSPSEAKFFEPVDVNQLEWTENGLEADHFMKDWMFKIIGSENGEYGDVMSDMKLVGVVCLAIITVWALAILIRCFCCADHMTLVRKKGPGTGTDWAGNGYRYENSATNQNIFQKCCPCFSKMFL